MKTNSTSSSCPKFNTNKWFRTFIAIVMISLVLPLTAYTQWQGNVVTNSEQNQINPMMTTDGSGGTIITWQSNYNGKYEIFAQRMSANGVALWTGNGITVCAQDSNYNPVIVSDGSGGAIIAWQSYRGSNTADIYAQRINSSGAVQWTANGVPVSTVVFEQDTIAMISDGLGGAILTWQD